MPIIRFFPVGFFLYALLLSFITECTLLEIPVYSYNFYILLPRTDEEKKIHFHNRFTILPSSILSYLITTAVTSPTNGKFLSIVCSTIEDINIMIVIDQCFDTVHITQPGVDWPTAIYRLRDRCAAGF